MKNFTFKKQPKETGLAAIGNPHADVDIKHNKKIVGTICAPSWQTPDSLWRIRFMIKQGDGFRWATLKYKAESEEQARGFIKANAERLLQDLDLYHQDDE